MEEDVLFLKMNDEDPTLRNERERRNARPPTRYVHYEALELINDSDEYFSDFISINGSSSSECDDSDSDTLYMLAEQEVSQDDGDDSPLDWTLVPEDLYHGPLLVNESLPYQWSDF